MKIGNIEIDDDKIKGYIKKYYINNDEDLVCKTTYKIEEDGKIYYANVETKNKKEIGFAINYKEIRISGGTLKDDYKDVLEK